MNTLTFNFPFLAACITIIAAMVLVIATRTADGWRRIAIVLLCCDLTVSAVATLIGLKGADAAMIHGASLGFTVSALLVVVLRNVAPSNNRWGGRDAR